MKEFLDSEYPTTRSRVVPLSLFKAIHDAQVNMKLFFDSIDFGSLHGISMERIPWSEVSKLLDYKLFADCHCFRLCRLVVVHENQKSFKFST